MTHEEFTALTGVETTYNYYHSVIEPAYTAADTEKSEFADRWMKDNKAHIVKAHAFDIDSASLKLAVAEAKSAEFEKLKAENTRLQRQAEEWEDRYKASDSAFREAKHMSESWQKDYYAARAIADQVEPLKGTVAALENEIIRLKARLYDMMVAENKTK